ncbi:unnamed protein product [Lupinus luteus]|uniref:TF-B3 domain-containing protein n=1 Tax=Lupinus luteus TaxID=3873 RepID=A0AAV1XBK0_LUPLU
MAFSCHICLWIYLNFTLRDSHFIVFKYEGGSHFEVRIFDVTTYNEIEYSSISCTNDATKNHYNEVESDNSVEIIEIDDDSDEIVENELHTLLAKKRKINTKSEHGSDINVDFDATQKNVSSGSTSGRERERSMINAKSCFKSEASTIQKDLLMDKARDYINKTKNPAFIQQLFTSYVGAASNDILGISTVFAREYLKGFVGEATIGILHEKRTWPVRIKVSHGSGQTFMVGGWKSFWQHYKLQVNDVCVFEMTQHTPLSFKVVIFPAREQH